MEAEVEAVPYHQIPLVDPDARAMVMSGRGSGIVAVKSSPLFWRYHHLTTAHQVFMPGLSTSSSSPPW